MIKKILLKIAYWINKHYKTIEIKHEDIIKYQDVYFKIISTEHSKRFGEYDELKIEARDINSWLNFHRV